MPIVEAAAHAGLTARCPQCAHKMRQEQLGSWRCPNCGWHGDQTDLEKTRQANAERAGTG
jgi:ribosomal protein L37AE/L43A